MKQKEKIDLVLRKLYDLRDDVYSHTLTDIMKELSIFENNTDMHRLATRLEDERLVKLTRMRSGVDVEITTYGIDYYEENLTGAMKQSEKAEAVLRWLYERRNKGTLMQELEAIMEEIGIYENREEAERIAADLVSRNFITFLPVEDGAGIVGGINSRGVNYCEGTLTNEYGAAPSSSITIHGGVTAGNAVFGNNNPHIHQSNTASTKEAEELINTIREELQKSHQLDDDQKAALVECITDIEENVKAQKPVRRYQWSTLVTNTAGIAQIADLVVQLGQILQVIPPTPTL